MDCYILHANFILILRFKCARNGVECESFTIVSINFFFVHKSKYYLQVHVDNCTNKFTEKKVIDYLDGNLFYTDQD